MRHREAVCSIFIASLILQFFLRIFLKSKCRYVKLSKRTLLFPHCFFSTFHVVLCISKALEYWQYILSKTSLKLFLREYLKKGFFGHYCYTKVGYSFLCCVLHLYVQYTNSKIQATRQLYRPVATGLSGSSSQCPVCFATLLTVRNLGMVHNICTHGQKDPESIHTRTYAFRVHWLNSLEYTVYTLSKVRTFHTCSLKLPAWGAGWSPVYEQGNKWTEESLEM